MLIAGLTGGLATGKSFVASILRDCGCHTVEADVLGHEAIAPGGPAYEQVLAEFGTAERRELAGLVFNNPAALARLNGIVHPAVRMLAEQHFERIREAHPRAIVVYVAAILIESGTGRDFGKLILTTCAREQQIARALERPGATEADVLARLARQLPIEAKTPFADYIIDTSGSKEDTVRQTKIVFEELKRLAL